MNIKTFRIKFNLTVDQAGKVFGYNPNLIRALEAKNKAINSISAAIYILNSIPDEDARNLINNLLRA